MADGTPNSNPNSNQKNDSQQKPGLSWNQPGQNSAQNNQNKNSNVQSPKPITTPTANTNKNTAAAQADSTGRVISIIIGIVVVFALAAWGIVALHNRSASDAAVSTDTATTTTQTTDTSTGATTDTSATAASTSDTPSTPVAGIDSAATATVNVASPQPAGSSVMVSGMSLTQPTWVMVYETIDGKPGHILGATMFFKGDTEGTIDLLRGTTAGQTYLVSAAIDNGDHNFSLKDDKVVSDGQGGQMWIKFQTR